MKTGQEKDFWRERRKRSKKRCDWLGVAVAGGWVREVQKDEKQ